MPEKQENSKLKIKTVYKTRQIFTQNNLYAKTSNISKFVKKPLKINISAFYICINNVITNVCFIYTYCYYVCIFYLHFVIDTLLHLYYNFHCRVEEFVILQKYNFTVKKLPNLKIKGKQKK